ncbi:glycoside hydrolase family 16 protein [Mycolicibacterium vanbaalenii PYR-1]|nr:glycoside hydrolase family 16 protein [Mycolicibacterium vanbaalenii PYR-1]QZY46526.1 glycoside hydrolase family 16 protein [Mycolicibacterium austroafricanum]
MRFVTVRVVALGSSLCLLLSACTGTAKTHTERCPVTAAASLGWGTPNRLDNFDGPSSLPDWIVYDGPGHAGNGRRTPGAMSVTDGMLTITGDSQGNSGGMGWLPGQLHGRWEACVRSSIAPAAYHSLVLLWPDAEDWPAGGEVDFMEIVDPARQQVEFWLHWGPGGAKQSTKVTVDATRWHSYAVEWTSSHLIYYVDGEPEWLITDPNLLPPRPMHLCLQLDYFGGDTGGGAQQWVDWVRQYDLKGESS